MKFKKEYLILIIAIAALALYLTLRSQGQHDGNLPQPTAVEKLDIDRIAFSVKDKPAIILVKKDEHWQIEPQGYPADDVKVKNMVNASADLKLTALASESENYVRYDLTKDKQISVKAFADGKIVREFFIGKAAPTFQHTFVLLAGDANVYHARGQLGRTFEQSIENLRDKTIFDVDKTRISEVVLKKGDAALKLVKKEILPEPEKKDEANEVQTEPETPPVAPEIQWHNADGQAVENSAVDSLLGDIARMDCDAFLEKETQDRQDDTAWSITFKDDEGQYTLTIHAPADDAAGKFPATASSSPYTFELNKTRVERWEKELNKLLGIQTVEEEK
ncbi:MAG: DUF4340 domain-containing protein [Desulfatitalea sp.]|nr:DUF4340 domain-containing protein [Desulfatitalea sp.]NNK01365.1 DUF4340 domain-containing protein [Desulfatitalea sp.]